MGNIEDGINAVQTINATVSGVSAPAWQDYPASLTTYMLPTCLTWDISSDIVVEGGLVVGLTIEVIFEAIAQGSFDRLRANLLTIKDGFEEVWRPYVEGTVDTNIVTDPIIEIITGQPLTMTGILPNPESGQALSYPSQEYWGFKIQGLQLRIWRDESC